MKKTPHLFRFFLLLILTFAFVFLLAVNASAQQEDNGSEEVSISGSVDTYFRKSFQTTEKKSRVVVDLVLDPRGSDTVFNAPLY